MDVSRTWFRLTAFVLAAVTLLVSIPSGLAHAGLVETEQIIGQAEVKAHRAQVVEFLQREDVREQMVRLGIPPGEALARVRALSDAEVARIAGTLDKLPAGQSVVGAVVGGIVLIFLVLLITDLLGLTDVFPFVKKQKR